MGKFNLRMLQNEVPSYIIPLFWQHGETEKVLREEVAQMHGNGIGGFIVESRPHPDYLGDTWWRDLDILIDEAKQRSMKVWIFDDSAFPSGFGGGRIRDRHPQHLKLYLRQQPVDARGPVRGSSFSVKSWLDAGDMLLRVVAGRRTDGIDALDPDSLVDITSCVHEGILYWDVPAGDWRVMIFTASRQGGEEWTKDYVNPIDREAVRAFINEIYEAHYLRYRDEFGKTIAGFFTDEPRFGNAATYEGKIGRFPMVLPYSRTLMDLLAAAWGGDFTLLLPCLWYDCGSVTAHARYTYMDVVSRLYGENFSMQIGNWCREHNVKWIGHVVEDNGAHARLGYGSGHFFRALSGQDCSGLDVVYQVWPEYTEGRFTSPFGYLDADFFYWGMVKMAASAGHIDAKKNGTTVCEIFGAYGWQEGLKLMKWLTDHVCVRGVNVLIPHAFSPAFPDPDCPPHFYAQGMNPQWRYFHHWSQYANRVCHLLSGGRHVNRIGVVYHGESEWAGECESFEKVVKVLAQHQLDCDVLPMDALMDEQYGRLDSQGLCIGEETFQVLILPYLQYIPGDFARRLDVLAENGMYILCMKDWPQGLTEEAQAHIERWKQHSGVCNAVYEELPGLLRGWGMQDVQTENPVPFLRYYHYSHTGEELYFFVNESKYHTVGTCIQIRTKGTPAAYDAMKNRLYRVKWQWDGEFTSLHLHLEPYQSLFLIFAEDDMIAQTAESLADIYRLEQSLVLEGPWSVLTAAYDQYPDFILQQQLVGLGNLASPRGIPGFSGTIRNILEFELDCISQGVAMLDLGEVFETVEVWVNHIPSGTLICPPYKLDVSGTLIAGKNILQVDVTNTLVQKHGNNIFDRGMPHEPVGLLGPVRLLLYNE